MQVSTVDAFQGAERDIVLVSACRTEALGFITCPRRLNVALTRSRHHLVVVGKASNLTRHRGWANIIDACQGFPNKIETIVASSEVRRSQRCHHPPTDVMIFEWYLHCFIACR